jgi:hypothetical protein
VKARLLMLAFSLLFFSTPGLPQTPPARVAGGQQLPPGHVFSNDTIIYVSDFELDTQDLAVDKGGVVNKVRPGILERPRKREQQDPEVQAEKLVDLMSKSIVSDLRKAGCRAERLAAGDARQPQERGSMGCSPKWTKGIDCTGLFWASGPARLRWTCT